MGGGVWLGDYDHRKNHSNPFNAWRDIGLSPSYRGMLDERVVLLRSVFVADS